MSDIHMLDKAIRESKWDRALVSFNTEKYNKRYHIGTGFLYSLGNDIFLVTANHVIEESLKQECRTYVVFQIDKQGHYLKCPIEQFEFFKLEHYDLAFCLLKFEFLFRNLPKHILPSMISFRARRGIDELEDMFENNMFLFGYTGTENSNTLIHREYSFTWRTLLTKRKEILEHNIDIADPIFVDFDRNNTIDLDENQPIDKHKVSGNFPALKGMSGGPCLHPKVKDGILILDHVCGVIVEQLVKPPFNGKILVIAPIYPIITKIKEICKYSKIIP